MRNLILTTAIILGLVMTTKGQNVQFGIKGGLNLANLSGDTFGLDSRTSLHFGALVEIPMSKVFSIQPEIMYSAQGAKSDNDLLKLDYLNILGMAKYYAADGVSFEAGPQIGFLLSATSEIDDEGDIKDELNEFDFGINFGVGYKMETGLNLGLRYNLGLANVYNNITDFFFDDDFKAQNGVFQFYIGYMF